MLALEETRCGRCNALLDAPDSEHDCRTLTERLDAMKRAAAAREHPPADPAKALAMAGDADVHVDDPRVPE